MIVKHNLTAMNSNRMLGITTSSQAKATEKLSSGYKINRAADDAAGLAISEKMRKQIRGLTQASLNAQDGISAVQTADGALNEVHDMVQRLTELTVKAANGTLSESDRSAVQNEVDQLVMEIDRVSTTTKFNETYLLRGSNGGTVGKLSYKLAEAALTSDFSQANGLNAINKATGTIGVAVASNNPNASNITSPGQAGMSDAAQETTQYASKTVGPIGGTVYVLVENTLKADNAPASATKMSVSAVVKDINEQEASNPSTPKIRAFGSMNELTNALKAAYGEDIKAITSFVDSDKSLILRIETFADVNDPIDLSLHVGADSSLDNKIYMNLSMLSSRALCLNGLDVSGDTGDAATAAIDTVAEALQRVSAQRSSLGAIQNRLEHTIANLDNVVENTTAAEASIRDTDMASQMVEYSNNQILAQAGQAMLAQSNQATSGVLSLLQ
ncbi:MAG: flagellar hook protein [Lachnospiraceae bacterium]|nr:flagellar hook protein [Lachnospiraceae bacterium]